MVTIDALRQMGADVDDGLARCMNMESFYLDLVNMCYRDSPFVYSSSDFINLLKTDKAGFRKNYTYALFDANSMPQVIYRYYSAIESY